jgi:predicted dehydrogenase
VACLVEKPLAATVDEARELADWATSHRAVLQVGHTERFNPVVRAVMALSLTPRFIEVDRISPMTFRSLDVGVVMDMMIHDLDIVLALARSTLARVDATGVPVLSRHEDVASARLVFASGCVANLTASRLALKTERKLRIFSEDAYVSLDYQKRTGLVIRRSDNARALEDLRSQLTAGADLSTLDYSKIVQVQELKMDEQPEGMDDPLTAELSSFLDAATGKQQPAVDGKAGMEAVAAAQAVADAIHAHQWQGLQKI